MTLYLGDIATIGKGVFKLYEKGQPVFNLDLPKVSVLPYKVTPSLYYSPSKAHTPSGTSRNSNDFKTDKKHLSLEEPTEKVPFSW